MEKINRLLGIEKFDPPGKNFILKSFFLFEISFSFIYWLAFTFIILHVLTYLSFAELGILIATYLTVQFFTDYPTGVFGDWIGQRWVMFFGVLLLGLSYLQFAISNSFAGFFIAYILFGLAEAQRSGAYQSWFDNNYNYYNINKFYENILFIFLIFYKK